MTIPIEPRTPRLYHASGRELDPAFTPFAAAAVGSIALASFLLVAGLVGARGPTQVALVAGELMLVLIPGIAIVKQRLPIAALGLVRPQVLDLLAGLMIGCAAWYLNLRLVELLPVPEGSAAGLQRYVTEPPLALALVAIALAPAVCEEVLFRGVVLRALATRYVPIAAIGISAVAFAAYHLSLVQFVPTLSLGLVLGLLAFRARSAVPAMLAHLLNNGIAVLIARGELPGVSGWLDRFPTPALVIAALATGAGVALALRRRG